MILWSNVFYKIKVQQRNYQKYSNLYFLDLYLDSKTLLTWFCSFEPANLKRATISADVLLQVQRVRVNVFNMLDLIINCKLNRNTLDTVIMALISLLEENHSSYQIVLCSCNRFLLPSILESWHIFLYYFGIVRSLACI